MTKRLKVGQIVNVQGIRGELRVYPLTDYKERFEELEWVYVENCGEEKFYIEQVRYKNELIMLKLKGINDRNTAEKYKTRYLTIDRDDARLLPEDTYFIVDLIGLKVYSDENQLLGTIKDVIQSTGQDLYEVIDVRNPQKSILIPAVDAFIKEVNIERGFIIVKLIEGLIE
ncbi:ribosome maturation factor RimM [Clostridiaceae bacterium 35-E11]